MIFAGERITRRDKPLTGHGQFFGRPEHAAELRAVVEPIAAAEQQARCAGGDEAAAVDHAEPRSGGMRKRPVIIERTSLIGPASTTITK